MSEIVFKFYSLGQLEATIGGKTKLFEVDVCEHGVRLKGKIVLLVETDNGPVERIKTVYFGEGKWLELPNIEDAVLEIFEGTEEEVEELSHKYDDLMSASLPELITGNLVKGFVKEEWERLKADSDL